MIVCDRCKKQVMKRTFCCDACRQQYKKHGEITAKAVEKENTNRQGGVLTAEAVKKNKKAELQEMVDAIHPHKEPPIPTSRPVYHSDPNYSYDRGYDDTAAAIEL